MEGSRFPYTGDLILKPLRQAVVKVVPESTFTVAAYLTRIAIEFDDVLGDLMVVRHGQVVETMLRIADRVVGSEIRAEFMREARIVVHPQRTELGINQQEFRLEPIESHTLEVRLGVDDLGAVIVEGFGTVLEVQLALHEEHTEFVRVGTVELVRFADLSPTLGFGGLSGGSSGTSEGSDCSRELRQNMVRRVVVKLVIVTIIIRRTARRATGRTGRLLTVGRRVARLVVT